MRLKAEIDEFCRQMLATANLKKNAEKCDPLEMSWRQLIMKLIEETSELLDEAEAAAGGDKFASCRLPLEAYDVALCAMFLALKSQKRQAFCCLCDSWYCESPNNHN